MAVLTNSAVIPAKNNEQVEAIKAVLNSKNDVSEEILKTMKSLPKIDVIKNRNYKHAR